MPIVITAVLPSDATLDLVLEIEKQIHASHAEGLIAHAVTYDETEQRVRLFDIWDSEAAHDRFAQQHLAPVLRRAAAQKNLGSTAPESMEVWDVALLVTGPSIGSGAER
jgi:quinol monooxygenase YgiN